jgi:hypothetical protein
MGACPGRAWPTTTTHAHALAAVHPLPTATAAIPDATPTTTPISTTHLTCTPTSTTTIPAPTTVADPSPAGTGTSVLGFRASNAVVERQGPRLEVGARGGQGHRVLRGISADSPTPKGHGAAFAAGRGPVGTPKAAGA